MTVPEAGLPLRRRGTNLPKMGDFNLAVILDAIRRAEEGLSRVELSSAAGLAAQTVSNICRRLLDQGLIIEAGKETHGPGKPRTILRLNPRGMFAVGLHIDPAVTSYAVIDAVGSVIAFSSHPTNAAGNPAESVAAMGREIVRLVEESGVDQSRIGGVGVATPGPVDVAAGMVMDPPHMPGWTRVPLRDILARATGLPVVMDKDVTAAAVAEMWMAGSGGSGSFLYLYFGTGIGAGLVLNDDVVRGASGNAGEIGHVIADPGGALCDCGKRGCIKATCMPETLVAEARALGVLPPGDPANPASLREDMARLSAAAKNGDMTASDILSRSAQRMAVALAVLTNLLDVERVVFGGPFWEHVAETYLQEIPALLHKYSVTTSVHSLDVVGTRTGLSGNAFGAACLIMEKALSPNATQLILDAK